MKKIMMAPLIGSVLGLSFSNVALSRDYVKRMTRPVTISDSQGNVFSEIKVHCVSENSPRYIYRKAGQPKWCATLDNTQCRSRKLTVAKQACQADRSAVVTRSIASNADAEQALSTPETSTIKPDASPAKVTEVEAASEPVTQAAPDGVPAASDLLDRQRQEIETQRAKLKQKRAELEQRKKQLLLDTE